MSEGSPDTEKARIAALEAENGLRQYDQTIEAIKYYLEPDRPFALRPSLIQELQSVAVQGMVAYPGEFRSTKVKIWERKHKPPEPHLVKPLIQEMCDYVNNSLHEKTPLHLSAYIMWRLNWVHPFEDGNGRTSRAVSYLVLSLGLRQLLPGSPTIPQQIQADRTEYFDALERADEAWEASGIVHVEMMEEALKNMLAKQLLGIIQQAGGTIPGQKASGN